MRFRDLLRSSPLDLQRPASDLGEWEPVRAGYCQQEGNRCLIKPKPVPLAPRHLLHRGETTHARFKTASSASASPGSGPGFSRPHERSSERGCDPKLAAEGKWGWMCGRRGAGLLCLCKSAAFGSEGVCLAFNLCRSCARR